MDSIWGQKIIMYFGNANPPAMLLQLRQLHICHLLRNTNSTYYWKIEPIVDGNISEGCDVWSFKTKALECRLFRSEDDASEVS